MNKKEVMSFVKSLGSNLIKNSAIENGFSHSEKVLEINKNKHSNNKSIPKRVWIYWDSVEMSRFIKAIIDNNKKRNPEYDFIVLNSENLFDYIPRVNFHSDLLPAHKADYIRLVLLNLYGGIWLDATTVLVSDLKWIHKHENYSYDLVGYYRSQSTVNYDYPIVETWFLAAPQDNEFIKLWLKLFEPIIEHGSKRFFDHLKSRTDYKVLTQQLSNPSYLMLNITEQIASRTLKNVNMYLKRCEDSAFYIQENCGWDFNKINYVLCRQNIPLEDFPILKLTYKDRELIKYYARWNLISDNSIIGQLRQY